MPVSTVSGMNKVAITRQHLHHLVQPVADPGEVRVEQARDAILEQHRLVAEAHEVVVDVAEAIGDVLGDHRELAPREPADHVALRQHHAPHRGHVALELEDRAHQVGRRAARTRAPRSGRAARRACPPPAGSGSTIVSMIRCASASGPSSMMWSSLRAQRANLRDRARLAVVQGHEVASGRRRSRCRGWRSGAAPPGSRCRARSGTDSRRRPRSSDGGARTARPRSTARESRRPRSGSATRPGSARTGRPRPRPWRPVSAIPAEMASTWSVLPSWWWRTVITAEPRVPQALAASYKRLPFAWPPLPVRPTDQRREAVATTSTWTGSAFRAFLDSP